MTAPIRVTVWNEFWHENPRQRDHMRRSWMSHGYSQENASEETEGVRGIYAEGSRAAVAAPLREQGCTVGTATLDEPEHGLTAAVLNETDVLIWWGHAARDQVSDEMVERVHERANMGGMGMVALHSAH